MAKQEPSRTITEMSPGDFVKLADRQWYEIESFDPPQLNPLPRRWTMKLKDGRTVSMYDAYLYAKKEDL